MGEATIKQSQYLNNYLIAPQWKNRISLLFVESPDFFHEFSDFPLSEVGRSALYRPPYYLYYLETSSPTDQLQKYIFLTFQEA